MRVVILAVLSLVWLACAGEDNVDQAPSGNGGVAEGGLECDAGDEAFVQRAILELWGRHPRSILEVEDLINVVSARGREGALRAMMRSPEYVSRWSHVVRDIFFVNRTGERMHDACNQARFLEAPTPALAEYIRDHEAGAGPAGFDFTVLDVIDSAVMLDDISVVMRVMPFNWVSSRLFRADQDQHQLAMRTLYGDLFERVYLARRMDCMKCHNHEFSTSKVAVTPGLVERAVLGDSAGRAPSDLRTFFRIRGVLAMDFNPDVDPYWFYASGARPWGWAEDCGGFLTPNEIEPDELGGNGWLLGDVGPTASVWHLEALLHQSVDAIRGQRLKVADDGTVAPKQALGYMVGEAFAQAVWRRITGTGLTVAHFLPRNAWQRDAQARIANVFIDGGYSLEDLLVSILTHPYLNQDTPTGCGQSYWIAALFDPWTTSNEIEETRLNTLGDLAMRAPARVLLNSVTTAMGWTDANALATQEKILEDRVEFQIDIGMFVMDGETGFRGTNFREALAWEEAYGACRDPFGQGDPKPDYIDALVNAAGSDGTLEAAVIALKDRLITAPELGDPDERALMEALLRQPLSTPISQAQTPGEALRRVCAALLETPQFLYMGAPAPAQVGNRPTLFVPGESPADICQSLAETLFVSEGEAQCVDGVLQVAP